MANFESENIVTTVRHFPQLVKSLTLTEGQNLSDDADILAFAQKTVPSGKVAIVDVNITVRSIRNAT